MGQTEVSDEEILQSAQIIANFWILATMAYLKQHEQSIADWVRFGGDQVVQGFRPQENASALELARTIATSLVSLGGLLVCLDGDETCASTVIDFPAREMVKAFGLSLDEFDLFLGGTYEPLSTFLGLEYTSHRVGETWIWQISR